MKNRIRELREAKGWSMQRLADAAGTTKSQIYKLERGDRRLTVEWMTTLSKALDCTAADLLPAPTSGHIPTSGVKVAFRVDAATGGWIHPLDAEEAYTLQLSLPSLPPDHSYTAMTMDGDYHEQFKAGAELIFRSLAEDESLTDGQYVLVEEKSGDRTLCYVGRLEVSPTLIAVHFRATHPHHHHTMVYWQADASEGLREPELRTAPPEVPHHHGVRAIKGVLVKHLNNV